MERANEITKERYKKNQNNEIMKKNKFRQG